MNNTTGTLSPSAWEGRRNSTRCREKSNERQAAGAKHSICTESSTTRKFPGCFTMTCWTNALRFVRYRSPARPCCRMPALGGRRHAQDDASRAAHAGCQALCAPAEGRGDSGRPRARRGGPLNLANVECLVFLARWPDTPLPSRLLSGFSMIGLLEESGERPFIALGAGRVVWLGWEAAFRAFGALVEQRRWRSTPFWQVVEEKCGFQKNFPSPTPRVWSLGLAGRS